MRALLNLFLFWATAYAGWTPPADTTPFTTTVTATGFSPDWMQMNTPTLFVISGDFSLPAGYKVWSSFVYVYDASDTLVGTITDHTILPTTVSVTVPILADMGVHCMTLSIQLGTYDNLNLFMITALGGPQCFISSPPVSLITDVSVSNGPPSGGTVVDFTFNIVYPTSDQTIFFDCVFGTLYAPMTYTPSGVAGIASLAGACVSPETPPDRFVCVQIVPRGTVFLPLDQFQSGYVCSDPNEFAFSYYEQMPAPVSIDRSTIPNIGGTTVVITGWSFPDSYSTSVILIKVGADSEVPCTSTALNQITCTPMPSADVAGAWTVEISVSFNNGANYSLFTVQVTYGPVSRITHSAPLWGPYTDSMNSVLLSVSYVPEGEDPVAGPLGVCYYTAVPTSSVPHSVLAISEESGNFRVELPPAPVGSAIATVEVYLTFAQEDGVCDFVYSFPYSYRPVWAASEFSRAIVTGGAMSVSIVGTNLYQESDESKCKLRALWPADSSIETSLAAPCFVIGSMTISTSTSGSCDFDLVASFYQCGYMAARAATQQIPGELSVWDSVNLDVSIALNGVTYTALSSQFIRAIRLPVIKTVSPSFGFSFGGFVVELELQSGVAWEVEQCLFRNVLTGVERLVRASPFAMRTVLCVAPKWTLTAATVGFEISLLVDGSVYSPSALFTMIRSPTVSYASPREGPLSGYTRLSFTGTDFDQIFARTEPKFGVANLVDIQCVFGISPDPVIVPATYVSATVVECLTPPTDTANYVAVEISVNWMSADSNRLATLSLHQEIFHYIPAVVNIVSMWPLSGPRLGGTNVLVTTTTTLLNNGLVRCAFGEVFVAADWQSSTSVICPAPPSWVPGVVRLGLSLDSQTVVPFYFVNAIGEQLAGTTGPMYFTYYHPSIVSSTSPQFGTVTGGTTVMFRGAHFLNTPYTACVFGTLIIPVTYFISSRAVVCMAPTGRLGNVELGVTNNGVDTLSGTSYVYTYVEAQPLLNMFPFMGPISGGTVVTVTPANLNIPVDAIVPGSTPKCTFGEYSVTGTIVDAIAGIMECVTPVVEASGYYRLAIYYNGQDATFVAQKFFFYDLITIDAVDPPLGPQGIPNMVTITGTNFINTEYLTVRFGTEKVGKEDVTAVWISSTTLRAVSPPYSPAADSLRVPVMVSNNGLDYTPSSISDWNPDDDLFDILGAIRYYTLHVPVVLKMANPSSANMHGGGYVSVHGGPFMNTGLMRCGFDWIFSTDADPVFVSTSEVLCPVPDMWEAGASSSLTRIARLQVALVGTEWSDSYVEFTFLPISPPGYYTPHLTQSIFTNNFMPCGPGYQCPDSGLSAPLSCTPGTYQPSSGKLLCVACPIGYYCPHVRMDTPALCPPGWVCDEDGLISPYKRCPAGYVCLQGTSTFDPLPQEPLNGLTPSADNAGYNAPYRCLQGMYCLEGVVAFASIPGNYSTPQPCYQGSYCKPGSQTPFGSGAVPLGRFSPSPGNPGILCPARFACGPVTGSVEPHACEPGSYNFYSGQHNCTLAHEGSIVPAPMQVRPTPTECGHQGGRKGIFALSEIDLCPSATTCGFGVASNNEPPICFPVYATDITEINQICKRSAGQIYWPANTFTGLVRIDATKANCCWAYPIVDFFAEKIAQTYEQNPFGEGYEGKSARRWKQKIKAIHYSMVAAGYPAGFDGIQLIEQVDSDSLLTTFGVHCGRVRERIVYAIERYFTFKPPEFCAAGNFCNPGTCADFPTVVSTNTFYDGSR